MQSEEDTGVEECAATGVGAGVATPARSHVVGGTEIGAWVATLRCRGLGPAWKEMRGQGGYMRRRQGRGQGLPGFGGPGRLRYRGTEGRERKLEDTRHRTTDVLLEPGGQPPPPQPGGLAAWTSHRQATCPQTALYPLCRVDRVGYFRG